MIYAVAFVTGAIVMSFEMLGSRYLNPYFGSGVYTWAALISTVLITLTLGAIALISGLALLALSRLDPRTSSAPALVLIVLAALTAPACQAESLIDENVRVAMVKRGNGRIAHIETEYNDLFITKR